MSIGTRPAATGLSASEQRRYLGSFLLATWVGAVSLAVVALILSIAAIRLYMAEQRAREALEELRTKMNAPQTPAAPARR